MGKITTLCGANFEVPFCSVSGVKMLRSCRYRPFDYSPSAANYFFSLELSVKFPATKGICSEESLLSSSRKPCVILVVFGKCNVDNFIASSWLGLQFFTPDFWWCHDNSIWTKSPGKDFWSLHLFGKIMSNPQKNCILLPRKTQTSMQTVMCVL